MKICEICDKPFDTRYLVKRHKLQVHKLLSEPLKRGRPNGTGFTCKFCSWGTSSERELRRHINVEHSARRRRIQILCPVVKCPYITVTRQELSQHVLHDHSEFILEGSSITEMSFNSMTEFKVWKSREEKDTHFQYILARAPRFCKRTSTTVSTYFCHRSGLVRRRGKGMQHMKIQASCKINTTCPAMLTVHNGESCVRVIYSNVHFGHRREVGHIPPSKEEREQIAGQLAQNVPFDTCLRNIRDNLDSKQITRLHLLQRHDLSVNNTKFSEEENEEVHEGSNNVNNEFILNSLKASKSASSAKLEEISSMINELKAKTLDPTIINEPSKVNYIHNNLMSMLGFLSPGTSIKGEHCFPKSKTEPPNKKSDKQVRFFSTKKERRNVQTNLKVPPTEERKTLEVDLIGTQLFISNNTYNDHLYAKL